MNTCTIENTDRWLITSYGNGTAYSMRNKSIADEGIFVQGDDASAFALRLKSMCKAATYPGDMYYNHTWDWCLEQLYNEYLTEGTE